MNCCEKKYVLGIVTDEDAMFELLAKFLVKEGYEVKRVLHEVDERDFALIIQAPTRSSDRSGKEFRSLKMKKVLISQSVDEEFLAFGDDTITLSDRPLNLRQLSETIKRTLSASNYVGSVQ